LAELLLVLQFLQARWFPTRHLLRCLQLLAQCRRLRKRFRKKQEMNHLQEVLQQEQRYDDFENVTFNDTNRSQQ
jgi:hypothetical protein